VFKCFAAFVTSCEESTITMYLGLMLEPLNRAIKEPMGTSGDPSNSQKQAEMDAAEFPKEILQLLEEKCGTEPFLKALASVQNRAREKREKRKQEAAAEAVHNPQAAAKRKLRKQEREKQRKKRRVNERKAARGAYGKKPRLIINQD